MLGLLTGVLGSNCVVTVCTKNVMMVSIGLLFIVDLFLIVYPQVYTCFLLLTKQEGTTRIGRKDARREQDIGKLCKKGRSQQARKYHFIYILSLF